jgi:hypothetical protein
MLRRYTHPNRCIWMLFLSHPIATVCSHPFRGLSEMVEDCSCCCHGMIVSDVYTSVLYNYMQYTINIIQINPEFDPIWSLVATWTHHENHVYIYMCTHTIICIYINIINILLIYNWRDFWAECATASTVKFPRQATSPRWQPLAQLHQTCSFPNLNDNGKKNCLHLFTKKSIEMHGTRKLDFDPAMCSYQLVCPVLIAEARWIILQVMYKYMYNGSHWYITSSSSST